VNLFFQLPDIFAVAVIGSDYLDTFGILAANRGQSAVELIANPDFD